MIFRETGPDTPLNIIEPPTETTETLVMAPSLGLFRDDLKFWRQKTKEADRSGDAVGRRTGEEMSKNLRLAAIGRLEVEQMLDGIEPLDREVTGKWYVTSVATMAFSRMLKELSHPPEDKGKGLSGEFSFESADICVDYLDVDPHRSGLHAKEPFLRSWYDTIGIAWPETTAPVWYEGESIYLRVKRPAEPTSSLAGAYAEFYDEPFVPREFASIVPRLKSEVWLQG